MQNQQAVASLYPSNAKKRRLWKAAIKWPLYSVAVMPVLLAAGWRLGQGESVRLEQLIGFLLASVLLLLWENLTNDLFDAETGVDESTVIIRSSSCDDKYKSECPSTSTNLLEPSIRLII